MLTFIGVGAAVAAGIALQAAVGFGAGLLASPLMLLMISPVQVVALMLVCGLVIGPLILTERGQSNHVQWREASGLLAAAAVGLPLGVLVLDALGKQSMQLLVGALVLTTLWVQRLHPGRTGVTTGTVAGLAAGVLTTSTSLNGPPLVLWLRGRGHAPGAFRGTITVAFLAMSIAGLVALVVGHDVHVSGGLVAAGLAGTVVGWAAGAQVFRRLKVDHHRRAVTVLLGCTAVASLVAGLVG